MVEIFQALNDFFKKQCPKHSVTKFLVIQLGVDEFKQAKIDVKMSTFL
jgi:hypothetical protein